MRWLFIFISIFIFIFIPTKASLNLPYLALPWLTLPFLFILSFSLHVHFQFLTNNFSFSSFSPSAFYFFYFPSVSNSVPWSGALPSRIKILRKNLRWILICEWFWLTLPDVIGCSIKNIPYQLSKKKILYLFFVSLLRNIWWDLRIFVDISEYQLLHAFTDLLIVYLQVTPGSSFSSLQHTHTHTHNHIQHTHRNEHTHVH